VGVVLVRRGSLAAVELPDLQGGQRSIANVAVCQEPSASSEDLDAAARWAAALEAYFRGERLTWALEEVPLAHLGLGTFQRTVYEALLAVPPATTVSYGELALLAGHPRAARAVGSALAANPIPVVIPCHRVIKADGSMGRYGNDPAWKPLLLTHEATHRGGGS